MTVAPTRLGLNPPSVNAIARTLNRITAPGSAPARVQRLHRHVYARTDGRVGHGMIGAPTLLLRTTGRRSGLPRTCALVYARDGDHLVLAASNEGGDHDPAWLRNVRAEPAVDVQIARHRGAAIAKVIEPADPDYPRLWALMNATNNNRYDHYRSQTDRPMPLVVIVVIAD